MGTSAASHVGSEVKERAWDTNPLSWTDPFKRHSRLSRAILGGIGNINTDDIRVNYLLSNSSSISCQSSSVHRFCGGAAQM